MTAHWDRGVSVYPAGVEVFGQGQTLEEVFFVVSGTTKLTQIDGRGRESLIGFATSSDWLGSAAVIADQPTPTAAVTCSKTVLHRYSVGTFGRLLEDDKQLSSMVHKAHAQELCRQSKWIGQLSSSDSRARLGAVLSRFALDGTQNRKRRPIRIQLPVRRWELAELIGITPEHLSRLFRDLERAGLISRDKGWIVIADLERLASETNAQVL